MPEHRPNASPSPSSPSLAVHQENPLDDVWASDNDDNETSPTTPAPALDRSIIRSEIPRLRSIHVTAGYRDGISSAKEASIQEGFDEGFAFGAEVGMAAGWVLGVLRGMERRALGGRRRVMGDGVREAKGRGVGGGRRVGSSSSAVGEMNMAAAARVEIELEGVKIGGRGSPGYGERREIEAVDDEHGQVQEDSTQMSDLIAQLSILAERDLSLQSLFSAEYIDSDGIWKYQVPALVVKGEVAHEGSSEGGFEEPGQHDIAFREIALAHPLLSKWYEVIPRLKEMMRRTGEED